MSQQIFETKLEFFQLPIDTGRIIRGMGYAREEDCPEDVVDLTINLLEKCKEHLDICAGYKIFDNKDVFVSKGKLKLTNKTFQIENIIWAHVRKAEIIAVFVCSCGSKYDEWIRKFYDSGDQLSGYVADTIGSEIAEAAADWVEEKIRAEMKTKGMGISNRLSPGYCEWNVSEQHKLFSLLPNNFCGVKLTESALMQPIKSVSGIIGIGKEVKKLDYNCNFCAMEHCYKRQQVNK